MQHRSLRIEPPFDLPRTTRALKIGSAVGGSWAWATFTDAGLGTLKLTPTTDGVSADAWGPGAESLLERTPQILGLDDPVWGGSVPKQLRDLDAASRGLKLGATGAVYELLIETVLGQLVTTKESKKSFRLLRNEFGTRAPGPIEGLAAFPEPSVLAGMEYQDLHRFGIERKRAQILVEVSRRAKRLEEALSLTVDQAWKRLQAVDGIGLWTAGVVMGAAYGDRDAVPVGDYHLPNSVAWALAGQPRADDDRMLELLEPFRPFRRRVLVMIKEARIHAPKYGPRSAVRDHL
ncbi:MAG: DNA-3-methyladenine glycosylase 2 family protein [Actinomycetota bacterium]|nr:DNA-3-methyladenine glycosylase 2 family protein [Actinomycetota bacterium]